MAALKKLSSAIIFSFIAALRVLFVGIYRLLFSWWLDTKSYSQKLRNRFAAEIQERLSCLFSDYGARIIPNAEEYPQAFDYTAVTMAVDGMLLRFIRGRMDFRVDVAPADKPAAWREISAVVKNSGLADEQGRKIDYYGLNDFSRFFQANFDVLRHEVTKPDWRAPRSWLVPI